MTSPVVGLARTDALAPRWRARLVPVVLAAAAVGFWWGATGVLLALQRSAGTRAGALALAVAAAGAGLWLTVRARSNATTRGGASAVLGGALAWTAVSAAFYGGWVVGPAPAIVGPGGAAPTLARAVAAAAATGYSAVLAAALLAVVWAVAARPGAMPGAAPRLAPVTFVVLWGAHELAKLNVFLGVVNAGGELLPGYLAPLRTFFGPARNSWLLLPSAALLAAAAAGTGVAAARSSVGARRAGLALVAGVLALASLEHALLGAPGPVRWWDAFLQWRGTA